MKISFHHGSQHEAFELPHERYQELMHLIHENNHSKKALSFCVQMTGKKALCERFIAYELTQKHRNEESLKELDGSCDYDDHL